MRQLLHQLSGNLLQYLIL